ncbi:baseplate J/gp47 family protein [Paraburkholderia atlantica]|uniref:baseplate J/gp47 family protein n=1 Tax=Paraburkholderia atlantica TaxID=2654982 RepID=UPI001612209E|nr:baseplate J/gp47 family protein [Paraburkholderia atlantica]MBB5508166.1 putative phage protein gp47/JayE [Paraburkholderia atlantica]
MALSTKDFNSLVSETVANIQGYASVLVDLTIGSILRSVVEATASVVMWLQGLILAGVALTRAATSNGSDLDSWFAQFGFSRLPAVTATTQETFSRFTPTNQALIPVGAIVQTADGSVQFSVIADTTNAAYSASQGGYVLPAGQVSVTVAVQCTQAGTAGNVSAGQLNTLGTAISGVDYVSNAANAQNGSDAEADAAARSRFVLFIASLEAATLLAVHNAIASVKIGMTGIIAENQQYNGQTQYGYFTVVANDGANQLTSTEQASVGNAIEAVRPLTVTYGVHGPVQSAVTVSMNIATASNYTHATVASQVQAALIAYINAIQTTSSGATLPYTSLAAQAYAIAGVTNVTGVLLNGGTSDLTIPYQQVFEATTGTVTVN